MNIKDLIQYLTTNLKFWVIINDWQTALHLRNGKIKRLCNSGIYFKVPFIDAFYAQPSRMQEIHASHINVLSMDGVGYTISGSLFFKITDIREYYLAYSEPFEIMSAMLRNNIVKISSSLKALDFNINIMEICILNGLHTEEKKGFEFIEFKVVTITNAKTFRLIQDNLYSQEKSELDTIVY